MSDTANSVNPGENRTPSGVPAGFFIYNASGNEEIRYADENVIALFGCDDIEDFQIGRASCRERV